MAADRENADLARKTFYFELIRDYKESMLKTAKVELELWHLETQLNRTATLGKQRDYLVRLKINE